MSKLTEGTGFHQPENYDCSQEGSGWRFWEGANDWEHATTWMWVVFPGDSQNKRVWVEINYEGHGNPDDGEVRYDGPEAKEAKAWGKKAVATWLRIAKRLHSEKRENESTRQWIDAFKDALQDKEMAPFIKNRGSDATKWEPVKESKALVAKLLEDDPKDDILAMDARQPFMRPYRIVIDDGSGGSFFVIAYGVDGDSAISRALEAGRISMADAQSVQSVDLADEHGTEDGIHPIPESGDDELDALIDRVAASRGFAVVGTGTEGQKYYMANSKDTRFTSYAKDAHIFPDKETAQAMCRYCYEYYPQYQPRVEVWLGENEEDPKDFVARQNMQRGFTVQVGVVNPLRRRKLTWYYATHEGELVKDLQVLTRARANFLMRRFKAKYDPKRVKLGQAYHPGDPNDAMFENEEADDFLARMDSKAKGNLYVVRWGQWPYRCYWNENPWKLPRGDKTRRGQAVVRPDDATAYPLSRAMKVAMELNNADPPLRDTAVVVPREAEIADVKDRLRKQRDGTQESLEEAVYKRSSCQINAPDDIKDFLIQWGMLNIPEEKLYIEADGGCGREDEPHVTVRYGLDFAEPPEEFHRLITTWKAFPIRLAGVSLFKNDKFDVVKMDVISEDLIRLNAEIRRQFPSREPDKFPDYHPHMTIAYVQKGAADQLEGADPFKESMDVTPEFQAERLRFSGAGDTEKGDRVIQFIPFDKSKSNEERRAEEIVAEALDGDAEADEFLGRFGRFVIAMIAPQGYHAAPVYLEPDGTYHYTVDSARVFLTRNEAEEELVRQRPLVDEEYTLKVVALQDANKVKPFNPAPSDFGESHEEDVTDLIGRMEPRRYALRFNTRPRHVGSVLIKPPWWDGHYWGAQGYVKTLGEAEDHPTFGHAWDARVALAEQLNLKVQDIEIVTHIGAKLIAVDAWPSTKGNGSIKESEADDFLARVAPEQFVVRLAAQPPSFREVDPSIGGHGRWGALENATLMTHADAVEEVANLRLHPSMLGFEAEVVPVKSLRMVESDDADDYVARMQPCVLANVPPPDADAFTVYLAEDGSWSGIREAYVFLNRAEAAIPLKKWQSHFEQKYGRKEDLRVLDFESELRQWGLNQKTVRESANPFGPLNFPVEATEVLTKIRARRNKRGAPAWF